MNAVLRELCAVSFFIESYARCAVNNRFFFVSSHAQEDSASPQLDTFLILAF